MLRSLSILSLSALAVVACDPEPAPASAAFALDASEHDEDAASAAPLSQVSVMPGAVVPSQAPERCPSEDAAVEDVMLQATWDELVVACRSWAAHGLRDYAYRIELLGAQPIALPRAVEVVVRDGEVVSAWDLADQQALDPARFGTIEDIFFEIGDHILQEPHMLYADYEVMLGMPRTVQIDYYEERLDDFVDMRFLLLDGQGAGGMPGEDALSHR